MDRKEQQIRALDVFDGCRPRDVSWIASVADVLILEPGTRLATKDRAAREFLVVMDGEAEATGEHGRRTLAAGACVGHDGLVDRMPHRETVTVTEPARVLVFEARAFHGLLDRCPAVGRKLMRELATEIREATLTSRRRVAPPRRRLVRVAS